MYKIQNKNPKTIKAKLNTERSIFIILQSMNFKTKKNLKFFFYSRITP